MLFVLFLGAGEDEDVIQVHDTEVIDVYLEGHG
jgi:hypothetical protein